MRSRSRSQSRIFFEGTRKGKKRDQWSIALNHIFCFGHIFPKKPKAKQRNKREEHTKSKHRRNRTETKNIFRHILQKTAKNASSNLPFLFLFLWNPLPFPFLFRLSFFLKFTTLNRAVWNKPEPSLKDWKTAVARELLYFVSGRFFSIMFISSPIVLPSFTTLFKSFVLFRCFGVGWIVPPLRLNQIPGSFDLEIPNRCKEKVSDQPTPIQSTPKLYIFIFIYWTLYI